VVAAVVLAPVVPAFAQDGVAPASVDTSTQAEIEKTRSRRAELALQIDVLKANDVELQAEAARLDQLMGEQERRAGLAREELGAVKEQVVRLEGEVAEARNAADQQRSRANGRAVAAYMHQGDETLSAVMEAKDYDQAHKRRALLGEVARYDQEVLKARRQAEDALQAKQVELFSTQVKVEQVEAAASADVAAAAHTREQHAQVQGALEKRIGDFQGESDELAASEGNLLAILNARASKPGEGLDDEPAESTTTTAAPTTTAVPTTIAAPTTTTTTTPGPTLPGQTTVTTKAPATTVTTRPPTTTVAPTTTKKPVAGVRLGWPLSGPVTSGFGMRWGRMHQGIDVGVGTGTPIASSAAGAVIYAGELGGYGNFVLVDHGNGIVTAYAHQSTIAVSLNQRVSNGQIVGYSGNTGNSTGPHLHYEVRVGGVAVDPMGYLG